MVNKQKRWTGDCCCLLKKKKKLKMELNKLYSKSMVVGPDLRGGVLLVPLSSGSGCSATWCLGDATHGSPPTGWTLVDPGRPQTGWGGCRRCRRHPRRLSGRGGWGSWCGLAYCSWPELEKEFSGVMCSRRGRGSRLLLDGQEIINEENEEVRVNE